MQNTNPDAASESALVSTRQFLGRRAENDEVYAGLAPPSQAVLRQFSFDRLRGYGLAPADVVELRAAVIGGADWEQAASQLAETALARARLAAHKASQIVYLRRASALLRMSQVMMLTDTSARREIFIRAAALYQEAASLSQDRAPVLIETETGKLVGWHYPAIGGRVGSAIVIGGVEGWAMDFDSMGEALAARGIDVLMLDGPGQGESRFAHGHYLTKNWRAAYRGAIDYMVQRAPGLPLAFVGNSLGGTFALAMAMADLRISACCSNCAVVRTGPPGPPPPPGAPRPPNFAKMLAFCGTAEEAEAAPIWETIDPFTPAHGADFPLLIIHGGQDPAVPMQAAQTILQRISTSSKEIVIFSDGDHCIYNHRDDRDALIADWVYAKLAR